MELRANSEGFAKIEQKQKQPKDAPLIEMNQQGIRRMVNGHQVAKMFKRFLTLEKSYCISLAIQLIMTVLYYELDFLGKQRQSNLILCCMNLVSVISILFSILSHFCYNDWKNCEMKDLQTLSPSRLFLDCIVILLQPYQMLQRSLINNYNFKNQHDVEYKLNYVLVVGSLLKLGLLIPCFMNMLKFKNPRSSRICKIYGCSNSNLYAIKCYFKQTPITLVAFIFLVCILSFSFAYRVTERSTLANQNQFEYYQNALWLVVVTMSSVGFGDYFPCTLLGRSVGFLCTFCGCLTVSIMVVVVTNTFQLDQNQSKSLRLLKRLEQKKQIKRISAEYIREALWRIWINHRDKKIDIYCKLTPETRKQRILRSLLKQKLRQTKYQPIGASDLGEEMNREFEKVQHDVQGLKQNSDMIINYLSNTYLLDIEEMKVGNKSKYGYFNS